ncbi:MAG: hypothetical protein KatS3mg124_1065 [Porticoccaceae bacterium]|nr:MAG: hypothetical protein KatS3mg124_1065 [Porticoccaceae bacterium]
MSAGVAGEVLAREQARLAALRAGDAESLAPLLSEELRFGHANAVWDDKAKLLAKLREGRIVYRHLEVSEEEVLVRGDMALLFARLCADVLVNGVEKRIDNRTLSVWIREGEEWRLLAYQPTPIPAR